MIYAFFDVDGTVVNMTSMGSFLNYYLAVSRQKLTVSQQLAEFWWKVIKNCPLSRERLNRYYYWHYRGANAATVKNIGKIWFQQLLQQSPDIFRPRIIEQLQQHQQLGHEVVFVSGGFAGCLQPIADHLGVKILLCTEPQEKNNHYTGKISTVPVIGHGKASAIQDFLCMHKEANFKNYYAYGDHYSDLPMLELAGNACVASGDPLLEKVAWEKGWKILH